MKPLDHDALDALRTHHPAWRLLRSDHAALVASFLHQAFVVPNQRGIDSAHLAERLEDVLYGLRERHGDAAFPRPAMDYLDDWASTDKGWLRKYYRSGTDEAQFDLTPATEKAIGWLVALTERQFVGTESRLLTLFDLLRQMREGSETDADKRIAELERRRDALDAEIARARAGDIALLDDTGIKDRFQQFMQGARELLADFREVEHNFRQLDRRVRERIALWEGGKGELLDDVLGERDAIADSDQGRSFRAFWELLLSSSRQTELTELLEHVLQLPAVADMQPDRRTGRIHYDWMDAGEHAQRTVAQLSQQLRRFLDDKVWLENRRIMDILHGIEGKALALRESPPTGPVFAIDEPGLAIELPMERPLYVPAVRPTISDVAVTAGDAVFDASALFSQVVVDKPRLARHVRRMLQTRRQVSLSELVAREPLQQGLAELITYLQLGDEAFRTVVDETVEDAIAWTATDAAGAPVARRARLPRVLFLGGDDAREERHDR